MATRFYLRADAVPDIAPAVHPSWTASASMIRRVMSTSKLAGDAVVASSVGSIGVGQTECHYQFIGPPMAAGLLFVEGGGGTTFKCYAHAKESNTDDNCNSVLAMQIVSADGTVVREKASPLDYSGGGEFNQPSLRAKSFGVSGSNWNLDGTTYTTVDGDRLVIELGHGVFSGGVSATGSIRRGSDSAASDCPENETDTTGAIPWFEVSLTLAFVNSVSAINFVRPHGVYATIADKPVKLTNWQCDSVVNLGYRTLTGDIPESVTWAEQEAPVELRLSDGDELWSGKISLDPETVRGKRSIHAEGYSGDLEVDEPLLYRRDGGEGWVPSDGEPHEFSPNIGSGYSVDARNAGLSYIIEAETFTLNDRLGLVLWTEGATITKLHYIFNRNVGGAAFDVLTRSGMGPAGSLTTEDTFAVSTASGTANTITLANTADLVVIFFNCNAGTTVGDRRRYRLTGVRAYGRTIDNAFSAGEVIVDVGTDAGFDISGVQAHDLPILPLFWEQEKDRAELLTYMAALTDWQWQALGLIDGVPALTFGPFETTWTGSQTRGLFPTWESQKRYNRTRVPFTYISGRAGARTAAPEIDPFPDKEVVYTTEPLEHPQQDGRLAIAVATAQADYRVSKRANGRVEIGEVRSEIEQPLDGYHVKSGQLLNVIERPDLGPQRIVAMTYREKGLPVAEINDEFNVIRLLNRLRRRGLR